jgi:hypothetical protein
MVWQPGFSPDSKMVAAKVERNGRYTIVIDGKPLKKSYEALWDPVFSPDSKKILIKGIEGDSEDGKYFRQVLPVTEITG